MAKTKPSSSNRPPQVAHDWVCQRDDVAGIDLGAEHHYVSVPEDRDQQPVRHFGCTTPELLRLAAWLQQCRIRQVVLEATGVYWVPVFELLQDQGLTVSLVDGRQAKHVPGRKSDVSDCQWLRIIYSYGLVRSCFLPDKTLATVRAYWRQRAGHVQACAQQIHRMHKALEQMNVQLHKVLSDVTGVAGLAILRAIAQGERDPQKLASLVRTRVKHGPAQFVAALTGHYRPEHVFALRQALEAYDFSQAQMQACDQQIALCLAALPAKAPAKAQDPGGSGGNPGGSGGNPGGSGGNPGGSGGNPGGPPPASLVGKPPGLPAKRRKNQPYFDLKAQLTRIVGADVTVLPGIDALTAQTVFSECGYDLAAFAHEGQFSAYLGLSPDNRITGGKVRATRTRKVTHRAAVAFRVAAQSLHRSDTALGAFARRMRARLGPARAMTATAHKLAVLFFRMIRYGQSYVELGSELYEQRYRQQQRALLEKNARRLGYELVPLQPSASVS